MPPRPSPSGPSSTAPKPNKYHTASIQDQLLLADAPIPPPSKLGRAHGVGLRWQKMSGIKGGGGAGGKSPSGEEVAGMEGAEGPGGAGAANGEGMGLPTMESVLESGSGSIGGAGLVVGPSVMGGGGRDASEEVGLEVVGEEEEEDEDDSDEEGGKKKTGKGGTGSKGRKRISISYIEDKTKRSVTFTKRKSGLMKKAYELSTLTGTNVAVVIVSESGNIFTFCTPSLSGVTDHPKGREVIAQSLSGEIRAELSEGKDGRGKVAKGKGKKVAGAGGGGSNKAAPSPTPGPTSANLAAAPSHADSPHPHLSPAVDASLPTPPLPPLATGVHSHFPIYELPIPPPPTSYANTDQLPIPPAVFGSHQHHQQPPHQHPHSLHPYQHHQPHPHHQPQPQHPFPHSPTPHDFLPRPSPLPSSSALPSAPAAPLASLYPPHAIPSPLLPAPGPAPSTSPPNTMASSYEEAMRSHREAWGRWQAAMAADSGGGAGAGAGGAGVGYTGAPSPVHMVAEQQHLPPAGTEGREGRENPLKRKASDDSPVVSPRLGEGEGEGGGADRKPEYVEQGEGGQVDEPAERVRGWKRRAEEAVGEARRLRTLPPTFLAHSFSLLSSLPYPPPLPSSSSPSSPFLTPARAYGLMGEDADEEMQMFGSFERMCVKAGLCGGEGGEGGGGQKVEEVIEGAMEEFLGRWLPKELSSLPPDFRSAALASARSHLVSFLDFLEAHQIISTELHARLTMMPGQGEGAGEGEGEGVRGLGEERRERLYGARVGEVSAVGVDQSMPDEVAERVEQPVVEERVGGEEEKQVEEEPEQGSVEEVMGERRSKRRRKQ